MENKDDLEIQKIEDDMYKKGLYTTQGDKTIFLSKLLEKKKDQVGGGAWKIQKWID